jgi:N-methylhydantoinase B
MSSESVMVVDVVTIELVKNALNSAALEMQATIERTAYSQGIREVGDVSSSLFDRAGRLIAQAVAQPIQLAGAAVALRHIMAAFPPDTMKDGDAFILNDPFQGGSHAPDLIIVMPFYRSSILLGFGCSYAHHTDVGGMSPGSSAPMATEIFQEGILIPPLRLLENDEWNATLMAMISTNSRLPHLVTGDMRAQVASLRIGKNRLMEIIDRFGADTISTATDQLLTRSSQGFRRAIEAIPDGVYRFEDYLDDDGVNLGVPVPIRVAVTIAGDSIKVDFTGTANQVRGSLNCPEANSISAVYATLKLVIDPDDQVPNNEGVYDAINVVLPKGSLLNPDAPAAVSSRPETQARIGNVLMGAMAQALPDTAVAQDSGQVAVYRISGSHPRTGRRFYRNEVVVGGWGGQSYRNGPDGVDFASSNMSNGPVEALEMDFPVRVERYALRPDSAGDGKYRGGLGLVREIRALTDMDLSVRAERHVIAPRGIFGGGDAQVGAWLLERASGEVEHLRCKQGDIEFREGDLLRILTPGGGGYGDPAERNLKELEEDIIQGKRTTR